MLLVYVGRYALVKKLPPEVFLVSKYFSPKMNGTKNDVIASVTRVMNNDRDLVYTVFVIAAGVNIITNDPLTIRLCAPQ